MREETSLNQILSTCARPVLFLAHQDDELGCSGILQRLHDRIRVIFMTNGDGLAPMADQDPVVYARLRKEEALRSMSAAGVSLEQTRFLGYSEIEIYRHLARLRQAPLRLSEIVAFFEPIRRSVAETVYEFNPDVVFSVGFQGGHPEHDLVHYFAALALRGFGRDVESRIPLYHFPEYELTILLPMRFGPWYHGERLWVELSPLEMETKVRISECYPSQASLFRNFRRVVRFLTLPQRVLRMANPVERFFGREQVGPVPLNFDYRQPPYRWDFLNYMFEDFRGIPITFMDCIRPLIVAFDDEYGKRL